MLIGLGHTARVGKDTIGAILREDHGFQTIAFADALRSVAYDSRPDLRRIIDNGGWDVAKTAYPAVRDHLVALGNACRNHISADVWVDAVFNQIHDGTDYCITDVRYPNEAQAVLGHGGNLFRVSRPGVPPLDNIADQALAGWEGWTGEIVNAGSIEDLRAHVAVLVASRAVTPPLL